MDAVQKTIKELDNFLYRASQKGAKLDEKELLKMEVTLRWINKNLDKNIIKNYLKRGQHSLGYADVILNLLSSPEYDTDRYN